MKRLTAIMVLAVLAALLLCACAEEVQEPTVAAHNDYPGTYRCENTTIRERSTRILTVNPDGTYTYTRISTLPGQSATFTGTWSVDALGYLVLRASQSGLTSRATLSADTLKLDVADIGHADDTVGDGIYQYQFPEDEATPDAG